MTEFGNWGGEGFTVRDLPQSRRRKHGWQGLVVRHKLSEVCPIYGTDCIYSGVAVAEASSVLHQEEE